MKMIVHPEIKRWYKVFCLSAFVVLCFFSCSNPSQSYENLTEAEKMASYQELGEEIVGATFAQLSSSLMKALEQSGVIGAVQYCSEAAYPLTDSMAELYNVQIKRVSNKNRNPNNAPDSLENAIIKHFENADIQGSANDTLLRLDNGEWIFAKPIVLQPLCTKCHGIVGKDIPEMDYKKIRELYPEDKAIGFSTGDLRGFWFVRFKQ